MTLSIFVLLSLLSAVVSSQVLCDFTPIALPIKNVNLRNASTARGIAMSVGTPLEEYAFLPKLNVNNTWMYDNDRSLCPTNTSSGYCNAYRGGIFEGNGSTTFSSFSNVVTAGGSPSDNSTTNLGPAVGGSDNVQVGSNASLTRFPLGFVRNDWGGGNYPLNDIGLDFNSTLLSWLKTASYIGSRTYAIYWGLAGASGAAKMDGSLVLGGYDYNKARGKKYSSNFGSRDLCETGMIVQVTDIQLNFPNGTNSSITPGQSLNTCIVPGYPAVMSLPRSPFFSNFERLTNTANIGQSVGINYGGALYHPDAVYKGDLSITIASNLTIRIPNNQLVLPDLILDRNGNEQFNSSSMEVLINPITDINNTNIPKLGRQFLTAAYLVVNQDAGDFALFQANPTDSVHLLAIKDPSCGADVLTNNTSNPRNSTISGPGSSTTCGSGSSMTCGTPESPKTTDENQQAGIPRGAIIGAIVGACVVLILGTALAFFLIRSCRRRRDPVSSPILLFSGDKYESTPHEMNAYPPQQEVWAGGVGAEMHVPWSPLPPIELPATSIR